MIKVAQNSRESQEHRLKIKTLNQQMQNVAIHGAGLSPWEAKVLIEAIEEVYFADPAMRTAAEGQLKYSCVAASEPPGKKIEECRMVSAQAAYVPQIYKSLEGALEAFLAEQWETEHETVLPRRGSIHDMGPTLTHKKIILQKLFIEQKSVQQTSRETYHSLEAIQRYISTFRQVLLCMQKAMSIEQIAFATGRTERLIREYEQIIEEYRKGNYNMKRLFETHPHIENNVESWIIENAEKMEQMKN